MGIRKCVPADALTSCRISWKRHVGVGERTQEEEEGKKMKEKGKQQQGDWKSRRTMYTQKESMWCRAVPVFDI